jgi:hypothetical protein
MARIGGVPASASDAPPRGADVPGLEKCAKPATGSLRPSPLAANKSNLLAGPVRLDLEPGATGWPGISSLLSRFLWSTEAPAEILCFSAVFRTSLQRLENACFQG